MISDYRTLLLVLAVSASHPALAQPPPTPPAQTQAPVEADDDVLEEGEEDEDQENGKEIVVTGQRLPGRVIGDIPPEITLDRRQVRALGASNLAEMVAALSPQTGSGRGRGNDGPVVLLNGRRISGFREIRDLPPEAVDRVEILPEEVALKYGYRADQRVVNIVLRRRFRATTVELEGGLPTAGGRSSGEFDLNILRLDRAGRWSLDAEYSRDTALFESERDIVQPEGADDLGDFRTLLPASEQLTLGGTLNRTVLNDVSATLDARFDATDTQSRFGLPVVTTNGALIRDGRSRNGHVGIGLNGDLSPWRWSFTGNLDRNGSTSFADPSSGVGTRDRGRSLDQVVAGQVVANGPLFTLPAGGATASLRAGASARDFSSDSNRGGLIQSADLSRDRVDLQASVDLPIASRRNDVLAAIGDLSLNANLAVDRLSDFGTLTTLGAGLNWSPIERVRIIASFTEEDGAPSVQQLGDPVLSQANVRVFDFTRGETADVTRIDGGNPALLADSRRVSKLGLTVQPIKDKDLTLTANYTASRIRDQIASFPSATPEIEAAFPDRFARGADGRLLRIDSRPVNFARADREELRTGINFSKPLGKPDPARQDFRALRAQRRAGGAPAAATPGTSTAPEGPRREGAGQGGARQGGAGRGGAGQGGAGRAQGGAGRGPGGGGFGRGGFGGGGGFGGRGQGNLQIGLYHTWRFEDSILIRDGVPELDLLGGSAVGNRGGRPRHELEFQSGVFKNGFGARLTGTWQSGTTIRGSAAGAANGVRGLPGGDGDLSFGSFSTVNLRLFADLGAQEKLVRDHPFFRGARVSLVVDNLFDTRPSVRDAEGLTPLGYQGDLLDPLGRSIRISLRKVFFPTRPRRAGQGRR